MKHIALTLLVAATLLAGCDSITPTADAPPAGAALQAARPVNLSFDKSLSAPGVWHGSVAGDVEGDLQTVLLTARETGPILHVEFDWIVIGTPGGARDFTARLSGILNQRTGKVVMNGTVAEGWLEGARVHEEGQLIDPETLRFQGTIRIMPRTAR